MAAGVILTLNAMAGTVSIQSITDGMGGTTTPGETMILSVGGSPLASGFAGGGYFSITDAEVNLAVSSSNFALLAQSFVSIASDNFASGVNTVFGAGNIPGFYAANPVSYGAPGSLLGKTLYTFIGDGASLLASGAFALYRHADTIDADLPFEDGNSLLLANGTLLVGTTGTGTYNSTGINPDSGSANQSVGTIRLVQAIPEPSTALLGAIGALGLLRRRR